MNKKLTLLGIIATVFMFAISLNSCRKKSDDDEPQVTATMSATINTMKETDGTTIDKSEPWNAFLPFALEKNQYLSLTGSSIDLSNVLTLTISGIEPGSYKLGLGALAAQCGAALKTKYNNQDVTFASTEGEIVITKIDKTAKRVSGTFTFKLFSGGVIKTLTNGKFENLKY